MRAKDFNLPDSEGKTHKLSDYRGQWLVVYFYPKDDTPGCTKEACNFRDNYAILQEQGVAVVGISRDPVVSHQAFAEKYNLNFPLLSDESAETIRAYGAWGTKKLAGKETLGVLRNTYLIDPHGEIRKVYERVDPSAHAEEILRDLQALRSSAQ
jgi:thioredoxin-dependent peroxiredoxin